MEIPRLAKHRHGWSLSGNQLGDIGVGVDRILCETGRTESGKFSVVKLQFLCALKENFVLWIRARPTAFDIVDAQLIQLFGDEQLVIYRKGDRLALGAVPECRIEGKDFHNDCSSSF